MTKIIPRVNDPEDSALVKALEQRIISPGGEDDAIGMAFVSSFSSYLIDDALIRGESDISICDVFVQPDRRFFEMHPECPLRFFGEDESDLLDPDSSALLNRLGKYSAVAWDALFSQQPAGRYIDTISSLFDLYVIAGGEQKSPGIAQWMEHRKLYVSMVAPAIFRVWPDYMTARSYMRDMTLNDLIEMSSPFGFTVNNVEDHVLPRALRDRISYYLDHVARMSGVEAFHMEDSRNLEIPPPQAAIDFHALVINGVKSIMACRII